MRTESKSFPPSELKLKKLRGAGIFPYSKDFVTGVLFLGILAVFSIFVTRSRPTADAPSAVIGESQLYFSNHAAASADSLTNFPATLIYYCAIVLLPIFLALVIGEGVQSRFFSHLRSYSFGGNRLFLVPENVSRAWLRFRRGMLETLTILLFCFCLLVFVSQSSWVGALAGDSLDPRGEPGNAIAQPFFAHGEKRERLHSLFQFTQRAKQQLLVTLIQPEISSAYYFLVSILGFVIVYSFIQGCLGRVFVVLRFMRDHSMTREEVEAELRETELSPEAKRSVADVRDELPQIGDD